MRTAETVVQATKWASLINHVKNNRVEYLIGLAILHMAGLVDKAQSQISGVCF